LNVPGFYTGLFTSPSRISELDCTTTKIDTAERSISIDKESLQVFFSRRRGVLAGFTVRGAVVTKHGVDRE
jgi:lipid-binding SYLF domain-containing protein